MLTLILFPMWTSHSTHHNNKPTLVCQHLTCYWFPTDSTLRIASWWTSTLTCTKTCYISIEGAFKLVKLFIWLKCPNTSSLFMKKDLEPQWKSMFAIWVTINLEEMKPRKIIKWYQCSLATPSIYHSFEQNDHPSYFIIGCTIHSI